MQYRRAQQLGGCYFFTLVTEQRRQLFTSEARVEILRNAFRQVMDKYPFTLDAIVVLPDHLHCIWTLPQDDADFATRWRLVKSWFTRHCDMVARTPPDAARLRKGEQAIWQHRYWEHLLRDEADYRRHVEYIHYNPVKHGYVDRPLDWPYSSFRRFVERGLFAEDWGAGEMVFSSGVGQE